MKNLQTQSVAATILGALSVLFWGSTIALYRSLSEELGPVTAAAMIFLLGGALSLAWSLAASTPTEYLRSLCRLPRPYLLQCGSLFVLNQVTLFLAVGLASGRRQAIEVGLINYLWPSLIILFAVPLLRKRARLMLAPGLLIAASGVTIAMWPADAAAAVPGSNTWPCLLAFVAAVSWGIFSNLSKSLAGESHGNAIPVFLLATGIALASIRIFVHETSVWSATGLLELLAAAVLPTWLAFEFWDVAMRRGKIILVASLSFFIPLISVFISSLYLGVAPGLKLWAACGMVVVGAIICNYSITDGKQHG